MYVDYEYYKSLYGEAVISEADFNNLSWEACRKLDIATTGVDGVKKLKVAFPTVEDDAETVKRCVCKVIDALQRVKTAEDTARNAQGYVSREDGTLISKVVSSVSAGNESISYTDKTKTIYEMAVSDSSLKEKLFREIIEEYLSGVADANGVNMLYMGRYPYRLEM